MPRLQISEGARASRSSNMSSSDSEDSVIGTPNHRSDLWHVDFDDLDTTMWLSPRDKEEALANMQSVPLRLSDDGVVGLAVRAPQRRVRTRGRPRSGSRAGQAACDAPDRPGSSSSSQSSSGASSSNRRRRSRRNVIADITIGGFHHDQNPYVAEAVAAHGMAVGDAITFINGEFVDCLTTFSRLIDDVQDAHESRLLSESLLPPHQRQEVKTTLMLGLRPASALLTSRRRQGLEASEEQRSPAAGAGAGVSGSTSNQRCRRCCRRRRSWAVAGRSRSGRGGHPSRGDPWAPQYAPKWGPVQHCRRCLCLRCHGGRF